MANYTLNVLRDHTVYPNREAAIEALNLFEHHSYGQPLTILYKDDVNSTRVMFVVGIKNAEDETTIKHGPDFYEIINDFSSIKGEVDWKTYLQGSIIDTDEPLNVVSLSATDFAYMLEHWDERYTAFNDYVFFVQDRDKGLLYKGNVPYGGEGGGYILPIAGSDILGGIKVGSNLTIEEDGTLNAVSGGGSVEGIYISGSTMTIGDSDINDIVVGGAGDSIGTITLSGNNISIGTAGIGSVKIGTSGRLIDLKGSNVYIDGSQSVNIDSTAGTGGINIGTGSGMGIIDIGGSSYKHINIGAGSGGGPVYIGGSGYVDLAGSAITITGGYNIDIGKAGVANHITLRGSTLRAHMSGSIDLSGSSINICGSSGSINIGRYSSGSSSSINIGGSNSSVNLSGSNINLSGSYINLTGSYINLTGSSSLGLYGGSAYCNMRISDGGVNIYGLSGANLLLSGNTSLNGSTINIGSNSTGSINIGGFGSINIGGSYSSGSINIGGSLHSGNINMGGSNSNVKISGHDIYLGGSETTGSINVGGYSLGSINIGGYSSSGVYLSGDRVYIAAHDIASLDGSISYLGTGASEIIVGNIFGSTSIFGSNINLDSDNVYLKSDNVYLKGVGGYNGGTPGSTDVRIQDAFVKISRLTQAEYNALVQGGTIDDGTLYVITDAV